MMMGFIDVCFILNGVGDIEILDIDHVIGVQNGNKNVLINPPCWICPRSVVYKRSWGELNLPL